MTKLINNCNHHTIDENGVVTNTKTNRIKSHWKGANGYYHVDIQENGKATKYALHRLLATTFIPNPENKRTVNHIDGNKLNNHLSNLEWATDSENNQHAHDTGLRPYARNFSLSEYEAMLHQFLAGQSLTSIAITYNTGLTQLSYHIKEAAERLSKLDLYIAELERQKLERLKQNGIKNRNLISLHMIDKNTMEVVHTFTSIVEAQLFLNVKSSGPISNVLAGRQNSAYGYFWKKEPYLNDYPEREYTQVSGNV